jgi:hypothetical protein
MKDALQKMADWLDDHEGPVLLIAASIAALSVMLRMFVER